jgi:4-hydroxybenzoate polyprenyltransferase
MNFIKMTIEGMRPKQWIKNLLVFAPALFAQKIFETEMLYNSFAAFLVFCMASSAVYLINDVKDKEADSHHPEKKNRPIASGRLSGKAAIVVSVLLFILVFAGSAMLDIKVLAILLGYAGLNLAYTFRLKNIVLLDTFCIAFGFILRLLAGGEAIIALDPTIAISTWIILCTFLGSLFLAFCKRRNELGLEEEAANHRKTLSHYNARFLDQMIAISAGCTVMAYALWTMWPGTVEKFGTDGLFWTVPFVCYGIFRYLYLVHLKDMGGSPSKVFLSDIPLIINVLAYFATVGVILYTGKFLN